MTATYPSNLIGLKYDVKKSPVFDTVIQTSFSGKEQRIARQSYPRWKFSVAYEFVRDNVNAEFQTLIGFFMSALGRFNNFYFQDPTDYIATAQNIGTGDGATTAFSLVRSLGGFAEPILHAPTVTAIYFNGVAQGSGWTATASTGGYGTDTITFSVAPSNGVVITADFTFNFVCRFDMDEAQFSNFMQNFWELKQLDFMSVK